MRRVLLPLLSLLFLLLPAKAAVPTEPWMDRLGAVPIQHGGRVMPLDTYARSLAAQLTGRVSWSAGSGPEAYSGKHHLTLLCDLLFRPMQVVHKPLLTIESKPFKTRVGLDPEQRFFAPAQLTGNETIEKILMEYQQAKAANASYSANRDQSIALDLQGAIGRLSDFLDGKPLAIVPNPGQREFLRAGTMRGDPGTQPVCAALANLAAAYIDGQPLDAPVQSLAETIHKVGPLDEAAARSVKLETFYNHHRPWRMATYAYALSLILFGVSRLVARKALVTLAILAAVWGVAEQCLGLSLRVMILGRAPVSNTYEALLWMGLVGILLALIAQLINRKAWYLFAGVAVAELAVLFSALVPLESQTNALPAVLRSNYWLIIHVLTIVASYGILAVASLLGHVYLVKEVLLAKKNAAGEVARASHPLVVQTYRSIQIGLFLLTAGTILGGVWAADSWGRFWGWDPKETWALISIIVYFAVLHARYIRWLRDFGLAAAAVICFALIVWTFYGVNYLMASGLHSYGFGSGDGGTWVAAWALAETVFIVACKIRHRTLHPTASKAATTPSTPSGNLAGTS